MPLLRDLRRRRPRLLLGLAPGPAAQQAPQGRRCVRRCWVYVVTCCRTLQTRSWIKPVLSCFPRHGAYTYFLLEIVMHGHHACDHIIGRHSCAVVCGGACMRHTSHSSVHVRTHWTGQCGGVCHHIDTCAPLQIRWSGNGSRRTPCRCFQCRARTSRAPSWSLTRSSSATSSLAPSTGSSRQLHLCDRTISTTLTTCTRCRGRMPGPSRRLHAHRTSRISSCLLVRSLPVLVGVVCFSGWGVVL